jgi:hypothetical protein
VVEAFQKHRVKPEAPRSTYVKYSERKLQMFTASIWYRFRANYFFKILRRQILTGIDGSFIYLDDILMSERDDG